MVGLRWRSLILLLLCSSHASILISAKDPAIAIYEEVESHSSPSFVFQDPKAIPLWPEGSVPGERPDTIGAETVKCGYGDCQTDRYVYNVTVPTLIPYLVPSSDSAVVVAPGGGYNMLALDREGTLIAQWLNSMGISAYVLKYRVPGRHWLPFGAAPLMDAQRAMGMVRSMAAAHSRNDTHPCIKVGFMGFSAGGHLTGHLNVAWSTRAYPPIDDDAADKQSCRPDFSLMVYPWRSVIQSPVNEPGATALNVTPQTPPTFLVQTQDDPVHVENAIYYYLALKNATVSPCELHVYPDGGHGYGTCPPPWPIREVCSWTDRAEVFLQTLGIVQKKKKKEEDASIVRK